MNKKNLFYYKGVKINTFGVPLLNSSKRYEIKKIKRKKAFYHYSFDSNFDKNSPKNLIVMYDVPHEFKKERDWFRRQLIRFEYTMIQKSVWVGPSPLPKNFLSYIKQTKIADNFKTFKLAKPFK